MGYWESQSADATDLWISPEFAVLYEFETDDGFIPIATVRHRFLPESRKVLDEHYAACWAWGQPYAVQTRLRRSDGSLVDCVVHGEPEFDASGRVRNVSGIVRDVTEETSALRRLADSEQRLADFVSTASDWCWESDAAHRLLPYPKLLDGNAAFQTVASGGKARWELAYAPEDAEAMARHRADMEAHRPFRDFTYTIIGEDGSRVSISTSGKPIFAGDGAFRGYRGTASDITQLRVAKTMLDQRSRALEEAHRLGKIGTWSYRLDIGRTVWSPELYQLLGLEPNAFEPSYESTRPYFLGDDADHFRDVQERVLRTSRTEATDLRMLHSDGTARDLAVICKAEVAHGTVIGIIGTVQDVTERKEAERRLEQLAYSDPLTGLANRALFKRRLASLIEGCALEDRGGALLLIDLDRFKEVNDSLGHGAGDELLVRVAAILRQELGPRPFIARLGGDEFAVLAEGCGTSDAALTALGRPADRPAVRPGRPHRGRGLRRRHHRHRPPAGAWGDGGDRRAQRGPGALHRQGGRARPGATVRARLCPGGRSKARSRAASAPRRGDRRPQGALPATGGPEDRLLSPASRRCCAGPIPSAGRSRRQSSSRSPKAPG